MDAEQQVKDKCEGSLPGVFLVIISAACFGFMAIFAKYAYAANLNVLTILSLRFTISAVVMWLVLLISREDPKVGRRQFLVLVGLGAMGYGLMSSFYFSSVRLVPASITAILLYTYPVIVTLLSMIINKEPMTRAKTISLLISSVGLLLVVGVVFEKLNFFGVLYGGMAAVVYSIYILISSRVLGKLNPIVVTTYIITAAALAFNVAGLVTGSVVWRISTQGWLSILGISIVSTVIAILTFFQGIKLLGPSRASIISTVEPVVTAAAAALLLSESMTVTQALGGILVIGAVALIQIDSGTGRQSSQTAQSSNL